MWACLSASLPSSPFLLPPFYVLFFFRRVFFRLTSQKFILLPMGLSTRYTGTATHMSCAPSSCMSLLRRAPKIQVFFRTSNCKSVAPLHLTCRRFCLCGAMLVPLTVPFATVSSSRLTKRMLGTLLLSLPALRNGFKKTEHSLALCNYSGEL